MRPDQLGDLAVFAAIATDRSFTRAARRLGVTQSALSQTMKRLEGQLGFRLLSRTTRSVAVVAAPGYLSGHPAPTAPADLTAHRCVAYGDAQGGLSPWSFERDGHAVTVTPGRGPVFNDGDLLVAAALEGFGILYILKDLVAAPIADGRLIRLLEPWCQPFAGHHLYYPDRQGTTAFERFKEAIRANRAI